MHPFILERPRDLNAALGLRAQAGVNTAPVEYIAGGTDMVQLLQEDVRRPERLVSLAGLLDNRVEAGSQRLRIGAAATMAEVAAHPAVIEYVTRIAVRAPVEVWTDAIASMLDMDLHDALESIKVPALVVVGDLDRLTPPTSALAMKRALPDAEMFVFRGAGHIPMLERPEQFNDLFAGFLAKQ